MKRMVNNVETLNIIPGELTPYEIIIPNLLSEDLEFTPPPNSHVIIKTSDGGLVTITQTNKSIIINLQDNAAYLIKSELGINKGSSNAQINLKINGCKTSSLIAADMIFSNKVTMLLPFIRFDFSNENFGSNYISFTTSTETRDMLKGLSILANYTLLIPIYIGVTGAFISQI